ncbi:hypothetical protein NQZ68_012479 [Dissostichus eleginoides]|nr:hypothetical protein NQZ68_012479 [Dissostichus eleginoides]
MEVYDRSSLEEAEDVPKAASQGCVCVYAACVYSLHIGISEERVSVDYNDPKVLCPFINLAS